MFPQTPPHAGAARATEPTPLMCIRHGSRHQPTTSRVPALELARLGHDIKTGQPVEPFQRCSEAPKQKGRKARRPRVLLSLSIIDHHHVFFSSGWTFDFVGCCVVCESIGACLFFSQESQLGTAILTRSNAPAPSLCDVFISKGSRRRVAELSISMSRAHGGAAPRSRWEPELRESKAAQQCPLLSEASPDLTKRQAP